MPATAVSESRRRGRGALICIPTYNERENIDRIVPATLEVVPEAHILVVDDNSPDGTGELAETLAAADERVHVLHRAGKEGLGRAYQDGFAWAVERSYEFVFEMDADFSHQPAYLPGFLEALGDADVVVGSRRVPGGAVEDWGAIRRFVSWGGSQYAKNVLGVHVQDLTGGFNGFRRRVLEHVLEAGGIRSNGYGFQVELKYRAVRAGFRVIEMPIVFPDRERGVSKMSSKIIGEAMINVVKLRLGRLD